MDDASHPWMQVTPHGHVTGYGKSSKRPFVFAVSGEKKKT